LTDAYLICGVKGGEKPIKEINSSTTRIKGVQRKEEQIRRKTSTTKKDGNRGDTAISTMRCA